MNELSNQIPSAADIVARLEIVRKAVLERTVELVVSSINTAVENRQNEVQVKMRLGNEQDCKFLKNLFIEKGYRADYNMVKEIFIVGWGKSQ